MKTKRATKKFEALLSAERLGIFRLLVKHAPEGLVAGELLRLTGIFAADTLPGAMRPEAAGRGVN